MKFTFRKKDIMAILSKVRGVAKNDYQANQAPIQRFSDREVAGGSSTDCNSSENRTSEGGESDNSSSGDGGDSDDDPDGDSDNPPYNPALLVNFFPHINVKIINIYNNKGGHYSNKIKGNLSQLFITIIGGVIAAISSAVMLTLFGLK